MPDREKVKGDLLAIKTYLNSQAIEAKDKIVREAFMESARNIDDAISLLKEQEAKPVIVTTNAYGTRFYHCPKCNRDLYVYPRQWYCSNCGQAVKWE